MTEYEISQLTNENGTGVYDTLFSKTEKHIQDEFEAGRIRTDTYPDVLLGSIQAVLQQSINFMLTKDQQAKQVDLIQAQINQTDAQTAQSVAQTDLLGQELLNAQVNNDLLNKQLEKMQAEIDLLAQKKFTEEAQTKDTVNGVAVAGSIGKQNALYVAQKEGFERDSEQKVAKIYADIWSVQRSTDEGIQPPTGITAADTTEVFTKLKAGIGT